VIPAEVVTTGAEEKQKRQGEKGVMGNPEWRRDGKRSCDERGCSAGVGFVAADAADAFWLAVLNGAQRSWSFQPAAQQLVHGLCAAIAGSELARHSC
jgi:hypothetical protein